MRSTTPNKPSCTGGPLFGTGTFLTNPDWVASREFSLTICWRGLVPAAPLCIGVETPTMLLSLSMLLSLFSSSTSVFKLSGRIICRLEEDLRLISWFATNGGGIITSAAEFWQFDPGEAHSITGVTCGVVGGGLGSLFRISDCDGCGDCCCCCDGCWIAVKKPEAPAAGCDIRTTIKRSFQSAAALLYRSKRCLDSLFVGTLDARLDGVEELDKPVSLGCVCGGLDISIFPTEGSGGVETDVYRKVCGSLVFPEDTANSFTLIVSVGARSWRLYAGTTQTRWVCWRNSLSGSTAHSQWGSMLLEGSSLSSWKTMRVSLRKFLPRMKSSKPPVVGQDVRDFLQISGIPGGCAAQEN